MKNDYKSASGNGVDSKRVKKLVTAAGVAALGMCAAVYYENEIDSAYTQLINAPPRDIEYDADGNEMHLMKFEDFEEAYPTFMQAQEEITEHNAQTQLVQNSVFPYQYWTKNHARGMPNTVGVAPGNDYLVFRAWNGQYLSHNGGGHMRADRGASGGWEKFTPVYLGGNKVGIKGTNNQFMCCNNGDKVSMNRGAIGGWEQFYIYKTAACGPAESGLPAGDDCIAIKSAYFNKFLVRDGNSYVYCNRGAPGPWEKWHGWTKTSPWEVDRIDFDLNKGVVTPRPPVVIGKIVNDNRRGTLARKITKELSKTIAQTESYQNEVGVEISAKATFETGVPYVQKGEVETTLTASAKHSFGKEKYDETKYTDTVECESPPGVMTTCNYIAKRGKLDVPYTMHLTRPGGFSRTVDGVWKGVSTFEDHITFDEVR